MIERNLFGDRLKHKYFLTWLTEHHHGKPSIVQQPLGCSHGLSTHLGCGCGVGWVQEDGAPL